MVRVLKDYSDKWRLKGYENFTITECGKIINTKTERQLKKCFKKYTAGYNIGGKFMTLKAINDISYIPDKIVVPF